ncbi:type II secretion system protein GspL [Chitinimonas sp.]|uniref:type II secretion system protein GspL n=1 Tax=Chitinimonas sp. TaxID=1934313 RepID=UPI0035ADD264
MSTLRLFVSEHHFLDDGPSEYDWRLLDTPASSRGRCGLKTLPAARNLEVYLPPSMVLRAGITLPPGGRRQAQRLLTHALDTVLLGAPEEQQLAYVLEGDRCRVAAIERKRLERLLGLLSASGRRINAIYAADMLLSSDGSSLLWYENGWARRQGDEAFWFDAEQAAMPPALLSAVPQQGAWQLALPAGAADTVDIAAWQASGLTASLAHGDALLAPLAKDAINLLQGEFASGPQLDIDWARLTPSLRWLGGVAVLACLAWLSQWWEWRQEEKALKRSMDSAFVAAFPGTPVVDAQLQLRAKLKSGPSPASNDTLSRLLSVAPMLMPNGEAKLTGIDYADGRISADYKGRAEQVASINQALQSLGQVQLSTAAADHVRLTVSLKP